MANKATKYTVSIKYGSIPQSFSIFKVVERRYYKKYCFDLFKKAYSSKWIYHTDKNKKTNGINTKKVNDKMKSNINANNIRIICIKNISR